MSERLFVLLQHVLPKQKLTHLFGLAARHRGGPMTQWMIRRFITRYGVKMEEALSSDTSAYTTFNDFFTRALKEGARPLADTRLVSPVDGAISQYGPIEDGQIFQAKGKSYTATALLAGDAELARTFHHGFFATLYLSPSDYHRVHMPCDGRLLRMSYVPGTLYSVNPVTARGVDSLFARNERVVCLFDSANGPFVLVLVGATIVGSMQTVWHGVVNPPRGGSIRHWDYSDRNITLKKGEEMGRFLLGSTVVMLFPPGPLQFNADWAPGRPVRMGEPMAD
ncbi:phosphatidylserine decarboxylase precursor [Gulbenkiania indica]|uniref:Phosphatidylserine decarboxylase proenzyme n=2 Tax=Gulbenkiania TaxID=397456 RepID=A0A0K6GTT7_9NEIS|nr:archaetidylserine decarboxylase [Gulbenkiania indica]TCW31877.1 phosphatidylserine decarboxylase [Gulbenkiania mobilis]CUA81973.1 phosphatidylserine decarboxylase precursor [Gulbenkiania indica]